MIESYIQNRSVNMTKEMYFEMCEMLGSEPVESEIPVDLDDFPYEVQLAFLVYQNLKDDWDFMGGNYLGKSRVGIREVMDLIGIDESDRSIVFTFINIIDMIRMDEVSKQLSAKQKKNP